MNLVEARLCVTCEELYEEIGPCPNCGNRAFVFVRTYIRPLHGGLISERVEHAKRNYTVQNALPMVVGDKLYSADSILSITDVQKSEYRSFDDRRREQGRPGFPKVSESRSCPGIDCRDHQTGIFRKIAYNLLQGCRRTYASYAVDGKIPGFAAFKNSAEESSRE